MTAPLLEPVQAFSFGRFVLFPEHALLLEDQQAVRIGRRAFDVLALLVAAHGQVVSKRSLLAQAWPALVVEESNLKVTIAAIRRLLGEGAGASDQRYIATVVGRGYRFVAPVHDASQVAPPIRRAGNLPCSTRRIVGREEVIAAIVEDLQATRLVSVVGAGGVGKTTVALAAAGQAGAAFKDGCWLVDLAWLDQPERVAEVIAGVTGLKSGSAEQRAMLVVLDNCEHLIGEVAQCADQLLAQTRGVKLIVTSREPLCIRGERVRRLAGLAMPPAGAPLTAATAAAYPAVQLFAERACEHARAFRLDDANAAHVGAICHRLDGVALAIEQMAQRVGTLGVAGLLEHLERRFYMLDGAHQGLARRRTLTASVQTSYGLLSAGEQASLRHLATLAGPFTLEAACTVCCGPGVDRAAVLEHIASLVAKSLLSAEPCNGEMLYRQTHVTRAFAIEQMVEHGELDRLPAPQLAPPLSAGPAGPAGKDADG